MQTRTKRLWGQDVDVVSGGLNEQQVTSFVNDLMVKYRTLVERQDHFLSLGTLSEKAALEADRMASDIRARAKEEAQTAAAKTVAQAKQRAEEMLANAKKRAHELTRSEADALLEAAHRKADVMETEAKQRAQLYLIRSRAVIEDDLKGQFIQVYDQMLSVLRELLGLGHDIESGWKGKIVELWKREKLELDAYDAVPSILVSEIARTSGSRTEREARSMSRPYADLKQEEIDFDFTWKEDNGRGTPAAGNEENWRDWTDSFAETAQGVHQGPASPRAEVDESPQGPVSYQGSPADGLEVEDPATEAPEVNETRQETASLSVNPGDLEGEVDISLIAPVDLSVMSKIYSELQNNREVKILRTVGSYDKGTTITVLLEKPSGVVEMLSKIPGVEVAPDTGSKHGLLKRAKGGLDSGSGKVTIPLRTYR